MGKYVFKVENNLWTMALMYMAVVYKIDAVTLLFLYEKFGKDVFYFFYMMSGREVKFPRLTKFQRIMESSSKISKSLTESGEVDLKTIQEQLVYEEVLKYFEPDGDNFIFSMEIENVEPRKTDKVPRTESGVSDFPAPEDGEFDSKCDGYDRISSA